MAVCVLMAWFLRAHCNRDAGFRFATQSALPLSQLPGLSGDGRALVTEFVAILQRALGQQAPVKQALYRGIAAILEADVASVSVLLPLLSLRLQTCVRTKARSARSLAAVHLAMHMPSQVASAGS